MSKKFISRACGFIFYLCLGSNCFAGSSCDINRDGNITPVDALIAINYINSPGPSNFNMDVNLDGSVTPVDVLMIINYLNSSRTSPCGKEVPDRFGKIESPEDFNSAPPSTPTLVPSVSPSLSPSPSPTPSPSQTQTPSPSLTTTPTPTPSVVPNCPGDQVLDPLGACCPPNKLGICDGLCNGANPDPYNCYNCPNAANPVLKDPECQICAGTGKDICGYCPQQYVGPFHPILAPAPKGPNECGTCGEPELNKCGGCVGLPNQPQPDICGNCPTTPPEQRLHINKCGKCGKDDSNCEPDCPLGQTKDECGICGGRGKVCGECPNQTGRSLDLGCGCNNPAPNECGCSGLVKVDGCDGCVAPGTECKPKCKNYLVRLNPGENHPNVVHGPVADLTCMQNILTQCGSDNYKYYWAIVANSTKKYEKLPGESDSAYYQRVSSDIRRMASTDECVANTMFAKYNIARMVAGLPVLGSDQYSRSHNFQMDDNCNIKVDISHDQICGQADIDFYASPISLNWESKDFSTQVPSVVKFSLDIANPLPNSLWYGSESFPLLVYDPEHKGNIESATQLFGNWTFGGKDKFALIESAGLSARPWGNGFEALGSLDNNHDGVVSDNELSPLALWFDKNQNAKSEAGEVVPLRSLKIKSIAYRNPKRDRKSNTISLKDSVTIQNEENTVRTLEAIDWYSKEFSSLTEASDYMKFVNSFNSLALSSRTSEDYSKDGSNSKLNGYWQWKIKNNFLTVDSDKVGKPMGILGIEIRERKLVGESMFEGPIQLPNGERARYVASRTLFGELSSNKSNVEEASFVVKDENGAYTKSTLKLVREDSMVGESEMLYTDEKSKSQKIFKYQWIAKRIPKSGLLPFGVK